MAEEFFENESLPQLPGCIARLVHFGNCPSVVKYHISRFSIEQPFFGVQNFQNNYLVKNNFQTVPISIDHIPLRTNPVNCQTCRPARILKDAPKRLIPSACLELVTDINRSFNINQIYSILKYLSNKHLFFGAILLCYACVLQCTKCQLLPNIKSVIS